jgi:ABC-type transporter Mla MlaB component
MAGFSFPTEVHHGNANEVLDAARQGQPGVERVFELAACQRFDSSLVAVLLQLLRDARETGAVTRFEGQDDRLVKLAGLYGVARLLFEEAR